jgi:FixJ family two-component response regulator
MDAADATVLLIDDDADVRSALARLMRSAGLNAETFASANDFLARLPFSGVACIVLDIRLPGMTGPELHAWMAEHHISIPVIYLSGHCDVESSVWAMKHGALDVLQKPADDAALMDAIMHAFETHRRECINRDTADELRGRLRTLSAREREVMEHVVHGRLNKQIASDLGISEKTVKVHRGRTMMKMRVRSVAELVHLCDQLELPF